MGKREKVYLRDVALWGDIDHEASEEQFPEAYAKLDSLTQFSNKKLVWKCSEGHSWPAVVYSRSEGRGCPTCGRIKIATARSTPKPGKSLEDLFPSLASEWDFDRNPSNPRDVAAKSNEKVWWKCAVGHTWQATVCKRSNGHGCPFCSGRLVTDTNRLSLIRPDLAREWDPDKNKLTPFYVTVSSRKCAFWKCTEGHSWSATIVSRSQGNGCPKCAKRTSKIEVRFIEAFTEKTDFTVVAHGMRLNQLKYKSGRCGIEVDILLYHNSHYLLLEYDGNYWHRNRAEFDFEKSRLLLALGDNILHARIREDDLPDLDLVHDRFAQFRHDYHRTDSASTESTVTEIENWFLERIGE